MRPDASRLIAAAGIETKLIGLYDAPDPAAFAPLVTPESGSRDCLFKFFEGWRQGKTLHLTAANHGCPGCGRTLFGIQGRSRQDFLKFLAEEEGLKCSAELMGECMDTVPLYHPEHGHLFVGPLRDSEERYLKTVTFFVTPDQLSFLSIGAQYRSGPADPPPVIAPFGAACQQMLLHFDDLARPRAVIGATDIAMRQHLPPDLLAFTVTKPMFAELCALDERSFIAKDFWKRLMEARHHA